ncbi:MAG: CapA family protein [Candidatus Gracilibacteria bacterium]|jgi:poly-gamma-glutamate synthesis protein (capsule biosynthesis protein)
MKFNKFSIGIGLVVAVIILFNVRAGRVDLDDMALLVQRNSSQFALEKASKTISSNLSFGDEKRLSILAFGDVMFGRYVRVLMDENGHDYPFEKLGDLNDIFEEDEDIIFANLEGPIKGEGIKSEVSMMFGFPEYTADLLKEKGFDVLSLANNHSSNMGDSGYDSTKKLLDDREIGHCGKPEGVSGDSVYYGHSGAFAEDESSAATYAFICLHSAISPLDLDEALKLIDDVRPNIDFLIVSIHWGSEYQHKPNEKIQVAVGHAFIDHGADLVIGHHPHVVQPFEIYKDRFIFYSLGNFIFDQYWSADTQKELAAGIILQKNGENFSSSAQLIPMLSVRSQPRLLTKEEFDTWAKEFIGYGNFSEDIQKQITEGLVKINP